MEERDTFTIIQKWLELDSSGNISEVVHEEGDTLVIRDSAFTWELVYAPDGDYLVGFFITDLDGNQKEAYTHIGVR